MREPIEAEMTTRHLVSHCLRARRSALRLTQQDVVCRLAELGLVTTNRALSNVERGAGLDAARLPELAAALECSVTYLVGLTDDPRRWRPDPGRKPALRSTVAGHSVEPPDGTASGSIADVHTHPPILGPDVPDLHQRRTREV